MILTEEEILKQDRVVPAIYKITNLTNGKTYVGSTKNYRERRTRHFYELRAGKHGNRRLQNAFNKYGEENFKMEMIMPVTPCERGFYEQMFIDILHAADRNIGYNILPTVQPGGMVPGTFKHTPESKERLRIANTGKKRTAEAKKNMSEAQKQLYASGYVHPNKGKRLSPERMLKQLDAMRPRRKPVVQILGEKEIVCYLSINLAEEVTGVNAWTISLCCRGKYRHAGGFVWRWAK